MAEDFRRKLPNAITLARLALAAAFFACLNAYRYPETNVLWANIAFGLFILAALTDALDGYLARRWQATTMFGRIMDPFCDKFLIIGGFIYLAGPRFVVPEWVEDPDSFFTMSTGVYPWMVVIIFGRELLVTGIRGVVESKGVSFPAKVSGKLKMLLQSFCIPTILYLAVNFKTAESPAAMWVCHLFIYATLIMTVWSGVPYVMGLVRVMKDMTGESDSPQRHRGTEKKSENRIVENKNEE